MSVEWLDEWINEVILITKRKSRDIINMKWIRENNDISLVKSEMDQMGYILTRHTMTLDILNIA